MKFNAMLRSKRHGIYYTPQNLSEVLTTWAVRNKDEAIFEPSFGECVFLEAIADRLGKLNSVQPSSQVFGCDIRKQAMRNVPASLRGDSWQERFVQADFLSLRPSTFEVAGFDVVIGNPPYVSRHNMFLKQRKAVERIAASGRCPLPLSASLWAFFVFHSLDFLKPGGRMAWVLPASALSADYARMLLAELCRRFERVRLLSVRERIFLAGGAEESSELLLCENHLPPKASSGVEYGDLPDVRSCGTYLANTHRPTDNTPKLTASDHPLVGRLSAVERIAWERWSASSCVKRLGEVASIRIGMVTGYNPFFVLDTETASRFGLPEDAMRLIFAKSGVAKGLELTISDVEFAKKDGARCLLFHPVEEQLKNPQIAAYLALWSGDELKSNVTFAKRRHWWAPDDEQVPDAFLVYMNHDGPRLILNDAKLNSTNTLHRLEFAPGVSRAQQQWLCVSLLSSFSQLGAELGGRVYGGGLLKHEPSDARDLLLVPVPDIGARVAKQLFDRVDQHWRTGAREKAQALADEAVAQAVGRELATDLTTFHAALAKMRQRRWRTKERLEQ